MPDLPTPPGTLDTWLVPAIGAFVEGLFDPDKLQRVQKVVENGVARGQTVAAGAQVEGALSMAENAGEWLEKGEKWVEAIAAPLVAAIVGHMLGIKVSASELRDSTNQGVGGPIGQTMAAIAMKAMSGPEGDLEPGDAGARNFLSMLSNMTLQNWFEGIIVEHLLAEFPGQEPVEGTLELARNLIDALGLSRLARVALRPLVQTTIATPLQWKVDKQYRPTLLPAAAVIRQFNRGAWEWADVNEELARHGYSDARIAALLNESRKFESVGDVYLLQTTGAMAGDEAIRYLREQGYDLDAAVLALRVEGQRRFKALEVQEADALVAAYVDRRITKVQFDGALAAHVPYAPERALIAELADVKLAVNVKHLSAAQARDCVKRGILSVIDYRAALYREGYTDDAVTALELLLRAELDEKRTIEQHRAELAAEKAAAAAARAQAAAEKKAEIEAARALKQQGALGVLEDAYVRGLIPIERLSGVLAEQFPADTVSVYLADVQAKRAVYVTNQQHAADAAKRAANKGLSVADLQKALVEGILTVDQIEPQLADRGLSDPDVAVLIHIMQDAAAAKRQADKLRADAARRAATRTLSLAQAEALVKGGHWTLAQFDAFLGTLGYDAADIASLNALVTDALAKQAAAGTIVAAVGASDAEKGLTLTQLKRGVVLGTVSIEAFQQYLVSQRYSAAAVTTLMADAQDAANTADAARARRLATAPAADGRDLPLATLTRAAQLGLLTPAAYLAALQARGYSDEEAALELDLLATEIATAKHPTPPADSAEATLAATAAAPPAAAQLRHVQVDGELAAKGLSLATVEKSVKAGDTTIDQYTNWLEANGYGHGDAEILTSLLAAQLSG